MKSRLLILCPGQGDQHAHMFDLARGDARAAALLDGLALPSFYANPALMFSNRAAQQLIVASELATWEAIRDDAPVPALVAGYSVGELAAYGVAGALGAADVVQLSDVRARAMDDCEHAHPGQALAAISGLTLARAVEMMAGDLFYVAIETADDSCIAGGPAAGLPALEQKVLAAGGRLTRLPVEVASHTPYLAAAVAPFAAALRDADFRPFAAPVLSGVGVLRVDGKALAVEQLSRQLAETIAWRGCMDACAEAGITVALELGPGAALARMMQTRHPHIACRSVADFRSLAGVRRWLEQQCS